jgi:hypothetical protein
MCDPTGGKASTPGWETAIRSDVLRKLLSDDELTPAFQTSAAAKEKRASIGVRGCGDRGFACGDHQIDVRRSSDRLRRSAIQAAAVVDRGRGGERKACVDRRSGLRRSAIWGAAVPESSCPTHGGPLLCRGSRLIWAGFHFS